MEPLLVPTVKDVWPSELGWPSLPPPSQARTHSQHLPSSENDRAMTCLRHKQPPSPFGMPELMARQEPCSILES